MRNIIDMTSEAAERAADSRFGPDGLNIVVATNRESAAANAERVALAYGRGDVMSLPGVAIAVKDNIATLDMPTTCGSRILAGYVSPYEATAITRLRANGAVVVAKTNMDEFAMGSSTETSAYGPTRNPIDPERSPGGSSGGSAAAVAAGITDIALGSETGGSVRQPAAFCGVVGVKPTYGRVSRFGLVAFGSSLDQIGVLARTVRDAAVATYAMSGSDPNDSTSASVPVPTLPEPVEAYRGRTLEGVTIGIPKEYFPASLDSDVRARCDVAIEVLRGLGAKIVDVSLPHTELAIPVYYIIAPAEASSNLARFDGVRYGRRASDVTDLREMYDSTRSRGFGAEVKRRIMIGTYVLSHGYYDAYYKKAQSVRDLITRDFNAAFGSGVDALFTPTTPTPAFRIGAVTDPYEMYMSDIFTVTANLAGIPAMSLPIGRVRGLPVGGQIMAPHFDEPRMFHVAAALEAALGAEAHA
ncbi:MAG TPA: Asp-tRNA(Asn)/Glu-tRNA(Gln) amidotransferase subunit GatA [Gemmatimonadaceae bacterium]|nr:Asp-tRNA(Asn)/Glu-tRNA(Gln) amidotransferase subunit GatA [Gemmatimonadaceae bacterium]